MHFKAYYDKPYVGHWDLRGEAYDVVIERIEEETIIGDGGRESRRPVLYFKDRRKGLILGITNGTAIAAAYGPETDDWIGKAITLRPGKVKGPAGRQIDGIIVSATVAPVCPPNITNLP